MGVVKTKNVPVLRFSEFSDPWMMDRIDNFVKRVSNPVTVEPNTFYREIGVRSHGKGIFHKEPVTGKSLGNKRVFWVHPKAFVVNIVFGWEQAVALTTATEEGFIASHRFPMFVPIGKKSDLDFLLLFFLRKRGKYLLELASPGGAGRNKTLGQSEFAQLEVTLPALAEQKKIAAFLAVVEKKLDALRRQGEQLHAYKRGVMQKIFSQELRFNADDGSGFPDWEEHEFEQIVFRVADKIDINKSDVLLPCIELDSLESGTGRLLTSYDCSTQVSIKGKFKAGDVLFGKLRPYLRKYHQPSFQGACSSEIWVLRGTGITQKFLYYLVQTNRFDWACNKSSGSKMPRADWDFIGRTPFVVPKSEIEPVVSG
ncbi:restriction endonuclease subunit S [Desulfuromonas carbonis]